MIKYIEKNQRRHTFVNRCSTKHWLSAYWSSSKSKIYLIVMKVGYKLCWGEGSWWRTTLTIGSWKFLEGTGASKAQQPRVGSGGSKGASPRRACEGPVSSHQARTECVKGKNEKSLPKKCWRRPGAKPRGVEGAKGRTTKYTSQGWCPLKANHSLV